MFDKRVILEHKGLKVTVVREIPTDCCSIGVSSYGSKPVCKFISKELHDKLIEELENQTEF